MTAGSSMHATIRTAPPQAGQVSMSIPTKSPGAILNSRRLTQRVKGRMPGVTPVSGAAPRSSRRGVRPVSVHPDPLSSHADRPCPA